MDSVSSELLSTQYQLSHEQQWRDVASGVHHQLLQEKTQLTKK